jgi:hypothetical protein
VLEAIAMDAVREDDRWLARTSARRLADELGIDPGTAASALRALRKRSLLTLKRESGPAGRFGLAVYVLGYVDGLTVVPPRGDISFAKPDPEEPQVAEPHVVKPGMERRPQATSHVVGSRVGRPTSARRRRAGEPSRGDTTKRDGRGRGALAGKPTQERLDF